MKFSDLFALRSSVAQDRAWCSAASCFPSSLTNTDCRVTVQRPEAYQIGSSLFVDWSDCFAHLEVDLGDMLHVLVQDPVGSNRSIPNHRLRLELKLKLKLKLELNRSSCFPKGITLTP